MVQFCIAYCGILNRHSLCATATTGKLISEATGLKIQKYLSGAQGGDQQIASRIGCDEIDLLLFFRDPLTKGDFEPNDANLSVFAMFTTSPWLPTLPRPRCLYTDLNGEIWTGEILSIPSTDISVDRPSGDGSFGCTAFAVSREGSDKRFNRGMPGRHRPADKENNKNNKPPFGYGGFFICFNFRRIFRFA